MEPPCINQHVVALPHRLVSVNYHWFRRPAKSNQRRDTGADGSARYADGTGRLPTSPLNDTYLVPEASQSRVQRHRRAAYRALDTALRRNIGHRPARRSAAPIHVTLSPFAGFPSRCWLVCVLVPPVCVGTTSVRMLVDHVTLRCIASMSCRRCIWMSSTMTLCLAWLAAGSHP
jgi:hypothetical protein